MRAYDASKRRALAERTRTAVLDAALTGFLAAGYAATTIESIAATTQVSVATIYKSYGGKTGLVRALCEQALEGLKDPSPPNSAPISSNPSNAIHDESSRAGATSWSRSRRASRRFCCSCAMPRPGLSEHDVRDILWLYSSPELYELLVRRRHWTPQQLARFATDAMANALLPNTPVGSSRS